MIVAFILMFYLLVIVVVYIFIMSFFVISWFCVAYVADFSMIVMMFHVDTKLTDTDAIADTVMSETICTIVCLHQPHR